MIDLHLPHGALSDGPDAVHLTPETASWDYAGLRVARFGPGEVRTIDTGSNEVAILPLAGSAVVEVGGHRFDLSGRQSVWERVSDWVYAPTDIEVRIRSEHGCELALPSAVTKRGMRPDPAHIDARDVSVEVRGAGQATRTIVNFCNPDAFPADSLIAVEVYTPAGNWSSYPPHKHDGLPGSEAGCEEAVLEELYYFRISGDDGFGMHRTYAADASFDESVTVRDGDVFLVPHGFHGPCIAAPGYDMYYLNVLAGPQNERSMAFCTDPAHAWIWESWADVPPDPRCPMVTA